MRLIDADELIDIFSGGLSDDPYSDDRFVHIGTVIGAIETLAEERQPKMIRCLDGKAVLRKPWKI